MLGIYCRTSKNKERDFSIENQQEGGVKFATQSGMTYKYYVDEGKSGTLDLEDRASFGEMMLDIRSGKVTAVYCIDQSRIERNTDIWRFFVAECINNNCKFYPNGKQLDLEDPESMLFANLLSLFNSFYAQITSKKVRLANYNKAKKGKTHGAKPFGYKADNENNYIIFENEASHVRRMFELSLNGTGVYQIAKIFNEECVSTKYNNYKGDFIRQDKYTKKANHFSKAKVKWRGNVIHDMLRNEIYKGIRVWRDLRITVPAIVSEELWQKVNDNLSKNKKFVGKKAQYHYLLNGLLYCAHCESEIIGKKRLKGNDNAYKCKGKRPPHVICKDSRGISLPKLETFIIKHLFHDRQLKELLLNAPKNDSVLTMAKKELGNWENEQNKTAMQIERLSKLLMNPELKEEEVFIQNYKQAKSKHADLTEKIRALSAKVIELENNDRNKRSKHLIESYTAGISFDELKKLVHSLIDRIEIHHSRDNKSGLFSIHVFYKNYLESMVFITDWKAMDWHYHYYKRKKAINEEQLEHDKAKLKYMIKISGKKVSDYQDYIDSFEGYESTASIVGKMTLKEDELIRFDYTT